LIDRDGDGFSDNDVTPIDGSASGNIVVFSGVNLQNGDRVTIGNTDASIALPIELSSFDIKANLGHVLINWTTASEANNDYFTIQRSLNGITWNDLKNIQGAGNSTEVQHYHSSDNQPFQGKSYYRLGQTDFDGKHYYSKVKSVDILGEKKLQTSPNPTSGLFNLRNQNINIDNLKLLNMLGRAMEVSITSTDGLITIDASKIPAGIYILHFNNETSNMSVRVIKR
jgi:hypothetical protein